MKHNILVLGASYGSLLGTKLLMAGHSVSLVCTQSTAELINREGTVVRFPIKGRESLLDVASSKLPGELAAGTPDDFNPAKFDLIVLAMQEAQYGAPGVRELMARVAKSKVPSLAIMNMPPLPYLKRIPGLATETLEPCYADPRVWNGFDPAHLTLASPDPQALRPTNEPKNILQVGLPTNFKAARFEAEAPTAFLRALEADIEQARFATEGGPLEIPVKLKVHDSLFVPLAKWPMLMAGNYRCIRKNDMISIKEAVHGDLAKSCAVYDWVWKLCTALGADDDDMVPFEKYAKAAEGLAKPSSAARALFGGAEHIERVDCLIRRIAQQRGLQFETLDQIVALVDERLAREPGSTKNALISDQFVCSGPIRETSNVWIKWRMAAPKENRRVLVDLAIRRSWLNLRTCVSSIYPAPKHTLRLSGPKVTGNGIKELAKCKNLQMLDLSEMPITGAKLKGLAELENLEWLSLLGCSEVTDDGISEVAQLKRIHTIYLNRTKVTDAGIKKLVVLADLKYLGLSGTELTDVGLQDLAKLKKLEEVDLFKTRVTDAGIAEFRKALPKCRIR